MSDAIKLRSIKSLMFININAIREVGVSTCVVNKDWKFEPATEAKGWRKAKPERYVHCEEVHDEHPDGCWLDKDNDVCHLPYLWLEYTDGKVERFAVPEAVPAHLPLHVREGKVKVQIECLRKIQHLIREKLSPAATVDELNAAIAAANDFADTVKDDEGKSVEDKLREMFASMMAAAPDDEAESTDDEADPDASEDEDYDACRDCDVEDCENRTAEYVKPETAAPAPEQQEPTPETAQTDDAIPEPTPEPAVEEPAPQVEPVKKSRKKKANDQEIS